MTTGDTEQHRGGIAILVSDFGGTLKNIILVFVAALVPWAAAQVTVVRAGRLIDPDSGTVPVSYTHLTLPTICSV